MNALERIKGIELMIDSHKRIVPGDAVDFSAAQFLLRAVRVYREITLKKCGLPEIPIKEDLWHFTKLVDKEFEERMLEDSQVKDQ